ncbi:MAG TPA: Flp pilus assembly protein CpaB [Actinomycetota bacterium]|nr:Flp pilus assembly protein CpaB [Actinomycetota bacterium]
MKRSKIVVIGGAVLAVLGMLLSYLYTAGAARSGAVAPVDATTVPAYVATADLTVGTLWEDLADSIELRQVPASLRPPQAITDEEQASGKTLVRSMSQGEILTTVQFNATGAESLKIPAGMRALTISVPLPQGVGDYIQPGSKADIYVTFKGMPGASAEDANLTQLLLSDVTVLANRRALSAKAQAEGAAPDDSGDILLTLAVTIEQAEKIIFAKENGGVWLTLMNAGEPAGVGTGRTYRTALA